MILIPNLGLIFVDIKYKKINPDYKNYPIDVEETKIYSSLQRKFNLHIWYVISNSDFDYKTWLWIPVSKVIESGVITFPVKFNILPSNLQRLLDDLYSKGYLYSKIFAER
ncbi:hypothetical protein J4404_03485 [Candidatus Woesearchaeota archaeon]|nr:hypothetical protein [Candidatus Woesearchaeota archaeon]